MSATPQRRALFALCSLSARAARSLLALALIARCATAPVCSEKQFQALLTSTSNACAAEAPLLGTPAAGCSALCSVQINLLEHHCAAHVRSTGSERSAGRRAAALSLLASGASGDRLRFDRYKKVCAASCDLCSVKKTACERLCVNDSSYSQFETPSAKETRGITCAEQAREPNV